MESTNGFVKRGRGLVTVKARVQLTEPHRIMLRLRKTDGSSVELFMDEEDAISIAESLLSARWASLHNSEYPARDC